MAKSRTEKEVRLHCNVELERALLRTMIQSNKACDIAAEVLGKVPNPFWFEPNLVLYAAINDLYYKGLERNIVTITEYLRANNTLEFVGGAFYVMEVMKADISEVFGNAAYYAISVYELWLTRQLVNLSIEVQQTAESGTKAGGELLDAMQNKADDIANSRVSQMVITPAMVANETYEYIKRVRNHEVSTLSSYYDGFNVITGGYQEADYVILAARPSIGKTAYTLSELRYLSYSLDIPTAFISLDSKRRNIMFRLFSMETGISVKNLRMGYLSREQMDYLAIAREKHANKKLIVDDTALRTDDIRYRLKSLKLKHNIQVAVIDFLQIVDTNMRANKSREREIGEVSSELKKMAKQLDITVIALSQLNRDLERRPDKRPLISDLRDSGAIEQDADLVVMLHRPEFYGYEFFDRDKREPCLGMAEVIVAKGRDVGTGNFKVEFHKESAQFFNPNFDAPKGLAPNPEDEEDPF